MADRPVAPQADCVSDVLTRVQLPLENIEYALEGYLRDNVNWLDPQTRDLLVAVRDSVGRVASNARTIQTAAATSAQQADSDCFA